MNNLYTYFLILILGIIILKIYLNRKNKIPTLNSNQFHLVDIQDIRDDNNFVMTFYNDEESISMYEFYLRIWNTFIDTRFYKENLDFRMMVILSDRANYKQITCHEPISFIDITSFKEYWEEASIISKDLQNYYSSENNDSHSYSKIYICCYY